MWDAKLYYGLGIRIYRGALMKFFEQLKKTDLILFCAAMIILAVVFFIAASGKRIQFCDEMFSYTITNSDSPLYQFPENQWFSHEEVVDKLTHTDGDSLKQTIAMVKQDFVHPPLYYIVFYIASMISGAHFSKWTGLGVNFVFFMGTVAFVWLIAKRVFKSPIAAFATVMIYTANSSTISAVTVIRMYMMMTFFLAAFVYVNILIMDREKRNIRLYLWLAVITAGGFMTQYYFALFGILFFAVEAVYDLINKRYKDILFYLGAMILAVLLSTLLWNFWIEAILKRFISSSMTDRSINVFSNIPLMLSDFLIASDVIRVTEQFEANGAEVLKDAQQFIIIAEGDDNGESERADCGLYYYISGTGKFAGREFLFRRNGLNYYICNYIP